MTLYATGAWNAELTHLKVSAIDIRGRVIHIQGGNPLINLRCAPLDISVGSSLQSQTPIVDARVYSSFSRIKMSFSFSPSTLP